MKFLLCCDKFKGSLPANEVNEALSSGIRKVLPGAEIIQQEIADGGDGSLTILAKALGVEIHRTIAENAVGKLIEVSFGFSESTRSAVIEMAEVVGLAQLPPEHRNPMSTSTYGLGQVINHVIDLGARQLILGIGGSATNDCGAGALAALGYRFVSGKRTLDRPNGETIGSVTEIHEPENSRIKDINILIACDVDNPLTGPDGATFTYASQKGAKDHELDILEKNVLHYAGVIESITGKKLQEQKGYGAAGGLALSFCELFNASMMSGSDLIFEKLDLERKITECDVIITGEGKIDGQTTHGKAISPVIKAAKAYKKALTLVCGVYIPNMEMDEYDKYELVKIAETSEKDSFKDAQALLLETGKSIADKYNFS